MRRVLFALFIGLALCVLAKPVAASAHALHEAAHAIADAGGDIPDPDGEDGGADPQHAEDQCCFHAVALAHVETRAAIATPPHSPPGFRGAPAPAAPPSRFLRPPIAV